MSPIKRFAMKHGLTYRQVADLLGLKLAYTRQLGCGAVDHVSPRLGEQIEKRSAGEITAQEMVFPRRAQPKDARR